MHGYAFCELRKPAEGEFPTYKLFDKEGRLLDLEVDARDVENIARLLEKLQR